MLFTPSETDFALMRRAFRLAMNGRGRVEPNPMVGCVLAKDGRVIGDGFHAHFGGPHAEPAALAACTESPEGATAYVTLEPCCHTNKKTPPCVPKLIAAKVARVVVGCLDPNPDVNGKGLAMLRTAGIDVAGPVLETEAKQLVAPFLAKVVHHRPYVTLKWAETADGKVAGPGGRRMRISNERSGRVLHELRARCDAILVGITTASGDDPALTVRGVPTSRSLVRVILDSGLNISMASRLIATAAEAPLLIFCSDEAFRRDRGLPERVAELRSRGAEIRAVEVGERGGVSLPAVLAELGRSGVTHLLVEPGPTLARSFFADGSGDRLWVFRSPRAVNDPTAPAAEPVPSDFVKSGELDLEGDALAEYFNPTSPVFFGPVHSADFVLSSRGGGRVG